MIRIAIPASLLPALALAHEGPAGHAHPHGMEAAALAALALAAVGLLIWRSLK